MTTLLAPEADAASSMSDEAPSDLESQMFCRSFVLLLVTVLASVAMVNFTVNPFAQYPTQLLPAIVQLSRLDKLGVFDQLTDAPEALIVGSSRVLKLEPNYVESLTGLTCFNAGVNYAVPIDHLAWFRLYLERFGVAPKLLIVGLDLSSFSRGVATDARLISNPRLAPLVRDHLNWDQKSARWTELLAWQQTRESLRSLKHHLMSEASADPIESYRADGLLIYHQREQQIAAGTYDFDGPLEFNKHEYAARYRGFKRLSDARWAQFESLAEACAKHGTRLIAFLTPVHPELLECLQRRTDFESRRNEFVASLARQSLSHRFEYIDLTEIQAYAGDASWFIDGIHQLEPNTRKLLDRLLSHRSTGAVDAL